MFNNPHLEVQMTRWINKCSCFHRSGCWIWKRWVLLSPLSYRRVSHVYTLPDTTAATGERCHDNLNQVFNVSLKRLTKRLYWPKCFYRLDSGREQMKPYNTARQRLTIKPCLASNAQQGRQKYPGIEFLLTTSRQRQDVLTHRCYIKL